MKFRIKIDDTLPGGVQGKPGELPAWFVLHQPYPNPARTRLNIRYGVPRATMVSIKLYDITGRNCRTLLEQMGKPGYYNITWDGKDNYGKELPNGVYIVRMKAENHHEQKKAVLMR